MGADRVEELFDVEGQIAGEHVHGLFYAAGCFEAEVLVVDHT